MPPTYLCSPRRAPDPGTPVEPFPMNDCWPFGPEGPPNPLARVTVYLQNRAKVARRSGFTSQAVEYEEGVRVLKALVRAAKPLAAMAALHDLYEGPPCHNPRHKDGEVVCYAQHGEKVEVKITLGHCRRVQKLLKS